MGGREAFPLNSNPVHAILATMSNQSLPLLELTLFSAVQKTISLTFHQHSPHGRSRHSCQKKIEKEQEKKQNAQENCIFPQTHQTQERWSQYGHTTPQSQQEPSHDLQSNS
uniref:Uncharacterized protein n=1 Tax=Sphaerodactylus townsendi TaxID=933632 RepID=A0ACB8EY71_9SAUR